MNKNNFRRAAMILLVILLVLGLAWGLYATIVHDCEMLGKTTGIETQMLDLSCFYVIHGARIHYSHLKHNIDFVKNGPTLDR